MLKHWSSNQKVFGLVVLGGAGFLFYRLARDTLSTSTTAGYMTGCGNHVAGFTPTTFLPCTMNRNPAVAG
jgi:hypothetical protein